MSGISAVIHDTGHGFEIGLKLHAREIERLTVIELEHLIHRLRSVATEARSKQSVRHRMRNLPI